MCAELSVGFRIRQGGLVTLRERSVPCGELHGVAVESCCLGTEREHVGGSARHPQERSAVEVRVLKLIDECHGRLLRIELHETADVRLRPQDCEQGYHAFNQQTQVTTPVLTHQSIVRMLQLELLECERDGHLCWIPANNAEDQFDGDLEVFTPVQQARQRLAEGGRLVGGRILHQQCPGLAMPERGDGHRSGDFPVAVKQGRFDGLGDRDPRLAKRLQMSAERLRARPLRLRSEEGRERQDERGQPFELLLVLQSIRSRLGPRRAIDPRNGLQGRGANDGARKGIRERLCQALSVRRLNRDYRQLKPPQGRDKRLR